MPSLILANGQDRASLLNQELNLAYVLPKDLEFRVCQKKELKNKPAQVSTLLLESLL